MNYYYNLTQKLNVFIKNNDLEWVIKHTKENFNSSEWADILYNTWNYISRDFWKHELAIWVYKEALKYDNNDESIYNNLATSYKDLWDYKNALEYYKKSFELDSKNSKRALRLAEISAYLKNNNGIKFYLEKFFNLWWDELTLKEYCNYSWKWSKELLHYYENYYLNKGIFEKIKNLFS